MSDDDLLATLAALLTAPEEAPERGAALNADDRGVLLVAAVTVLRRASPRPARSCSPPT
jgi:hypothetical protein